MRLIVPMSLGGWWIFKEEHVAVGGGNLMVFLVHMQFVQYTSIKENLRLNVSHWYMMDTYRKSYASRISPMPGPDEWHVDEGVEPIEPPQPRKQRGRLKKQRKR